MRKIIFVLASLWLAAALPAAAEKNISSQAGTSGAQFLKLGSGARAGGMGDAFTAVSDDVSAAYYNPGGLYLLSGPQITGAHTAYFQGMNYEVFQGAYPFGRQDDFARHTLAVGIYYLSIDDIEKRVSDTSVALGKVGAGDGAYAISYAYAVSRNLGVGATAKVLSQTIDTYHATSVAADLGALYRVNPDGAIPISLGFTVRNAGSRPSFVNGYADSLPVSQTFAIGAALIPHRLTLDVEGTKFRDTTFIGSVGAEYIHPLGGNYSASLRGGYSSLRTNVAGINGVSLGAGVNVYKASFDFAWLPYGYLGNTFRYSLLIKF